MPSSKLSMALLAPSLLLLFLVSSSGAHGPGGEHCPPVLCGNVNISYPFGRIPDGAVQTNCGGSDFQVLCSNNTPYLGYYESESNMQILSIFYDNRSLLVADTHWRHPYFNRSSPIGCQIPTVNTSSRFVPPSPFSISSENQNLIFYNCTKLPSSGVGLVETVCHNNMFVRAADESQDHSGSYVLEDCNAAMVPVLGVSGKVNATNYEQLVGDGFLATWQWPPPLPVPPPLPAPPLLPDAKKKQNLKLILIVVLSSTASLILTCLVWMKYHQQRTEKHESNIEEILKGYDSLIPKRYRYSELKKMTRSFKDRLGEGGYGTVFKGDLEDGRKVAVKLLKGSKGNGEEFVNEVVSIRRTSHVNIVNLLGFCLHGPKRALIYEYMANGSLEKYIQSEETKRAIGWEKLREIATGIARGLEYLHRGCNTRIIHFDIKPNNILLDEDFCPKIADFGLAKLCHLKDNALSMAEARGTIGFIAPEVFSRGFGVVSTKSDVYSYGMMLLEMVGGRKNLTENTENSSQQYFPNWVHGCLVKDLQCQEVTCKTEEIAKQMTLVGLWCIQTTPETRPSMTRVIEMLEKNLEELEMPPKPLLSCPPGPSQFSSELGLFYQDSERPPFQPSSTIQLKSK